MQELFSDLISGRVSNGQIEYRTQHKNGEWRLFRASGASPCMMKRAAPWASSPRRATSPNITAPAATRSQTERLASAHGADDCGSRTRTQQSADSHTERHRTHARSGSGRNIRAGNWTWRTARPRRAAHIVGKPACFLAPFDAAQHAAAPADDLLQRTRSSFMSTRCRTNNIHV